PTLNKHAPPGYCPKAWAHGRAIPLPTKPKPPKPSPSMPCPFCDEPGDHPEENCPVVFRPIRDCEHADPEDGCCLHPKNQTPECHMNACPRLDARAVSAFNKQFP